MRECWMEWRIQLTLQSKCKHIIDRNEQRTALIIFQSWFHHSFSAQMDRKALNFNHSHKLQKVWRIWSGHMTLYQQNRTKAVEFYTENIQPKVLKSHLFAWSFQSKQSKSTKRIVSILNNHWRHQDLKCILHKWSLFANARKRIKSIELQIRSKHIHNEQFDYLSEWSYKFTVLRRIKSKKESTHLAMIKNHFISWKVLGIQEKALRAKTTFIRMELRSIPEIKQLLCVHLGNKWKHVRSPIFRHFQLWKQSVQQTKQREKSYQLAKNHHVKAVYIRCFKQMSLALYEVMLMKQSIAYHKSYLIKQALSEWKAVHSNKQNAKALMQKATIFYQKQRMQCSIQTWRQSNRQSKICKEREITLRQRLNEKKMLFVFLLWTTAAEKLQLHRNQTWMSYEFRAKTLKRKCFIVWIRKYAMHSSLRERELHWKLMNNHKLARDAFYKWCNTYNGIIYKTDLLETHFNELCNYRLAKYFMLWMSTANCVRETRERYLVSKIFGDWKHATKRRNNFKKQIVHKPYAVY